MLVHVRVADLANLQAQEDLQERVTYLVHDSEFTARVPVPVYGKEVRSVLPDVAILIGYVQCDRSRQVGRALATYYGKLNVSHQELQSLMKSWADIIDVYFPEFQYKTKYYGCVLRQMRQMTFGCGYGKKNIRRSGLSFERR